MSKYELPKWILAVDPGKLTGIALIKIVDGVPEIVWSDETEYMETCHLMNRVIRDHATDGLRVVYERFIITPMTAKNSVAPWSLELIGVIKYLCGAYQVTDLVGQTSSTAKNFCPNPRLKAVGFWHRGGAGHARDALRHAVTHLVDCGWHHEKLLQ
jgi:hypothetical protein